MLPLYQNHYNMTLQVTKEEEIRRLATPRFAKQIVPAGKTSLIVNATSQRINIV
jgi:hypothetical protein